MDMRVPAGERHPLEVEYERLVIIVLTALSGNDRRGCAEYEALLKEIPRGIYRHHDGKEFLVLGIERRMNRGLRRPYYVAAALPLTTDPMRPGPVISTWKLIGNDESWFSPVRSGMELIPRFTLTKRLDIIQAVQQARRKPKRK